MIQIYITGSQVTNLIDFAGLCPTDSFILHLLRVNNLHFNIDDAFTSTGVEGNRFVRLETEPMTVVAIFLNRPGQGRGLVCFGNEIDILCMEDGEHTQTLSRFLHSFYGLNFAEDKLILEGVSSLCSRTRTLLR